MSEDNEPLIEKPVCPHCGREIESWDDYWDMKCCKLGVLPGHVRQTDILDETREMNDEGVGPLEDGVFNIDNDDD